MRSTNYFYLTTIFFHSLKPLYYKKASIVSSKGVFFLIVIGYTFITFAPVTNLYSQTLLKNVKINIDQSGYKILRL